MARAYPRLVGANKIKDEYGKINTIAQYAEELEDRVDTIIAGGGPDKDPELVDIRTPDPSYTPRRSISVAGDIVRDMQRRIVEIESSYVSNVFNVKTGYGAVGDGVTDDTAALQAALDDAYTAGGGLVIVPDGNYLIKNTLSIYSNTHLHLYPNAVILRGENINPMLLNGERSSEVSYYGYDGHGNIVIEGGTWDAQGHIYTGVTGEHIALGHGKNITIRNVTLKNHYNAHAIEICGCMDVKIVNCQILDYQGDRSGVGREAIQIDYMSAGGWPSPPWFGVTDETFSRDILIQGCRIINAPRGVGSHSSKTDGRYYNIQIIDNYFSDIDAESIIGQNWENAVISGNVCDDVGAGVRITAANTTKSGRIIITDNIIIGDGSSISPTNHGIFIDGNENSNANEIIEHVIITNNVIKGMGQVGIRVEYTRNVRITDGSVSHCASNGIVLVGCSDCSVEGAEVSYCGVQGILLFGSSRCLVSGCISHHNQTHGITLNSSSNDNTVIGNIIHSNNQAGSSASNIRVSDASLNNNIQLNTCRAGTETNKPAYGISLSAESTGNLVTNNDLLNSGTSGAIENSGTAITTAGNRIS